MIQGDIVTLYIIPYMSLYPLYHHSILLTIMLIVCSGCKEDQLGKGYEGGIAVTVTGKKCQPWAWQTPHE